MTTARPLPAALLLAAALASPSIAQAPAGPAPDDLGPAPAVWRPVDPTVADVDARGASQRQANLGLGAFTPEYRMRTRLDPTAPLGQANGVVDAIDPATGLLMPQPFRYEAPGVRARIQRPAYLSVVDLSRQDITFGGEGTREKPYVAVNKPPLFEPLFVELVPANTVFELTPDPAPIVPPSADWIDHRLDGRAGVFQPIAAPLDAGVSHRVLPRRLDADDPIADPSQMPAHETIGSASTRRDDAEVTP
ncbi:MAG: hypothetical protein AAFY08_13590 [Planctomycetota bacterium]